jgi:hypothetical protein
MKITVISFDIKQEKFKIMKNIQISHILNLSFISVLLSKNIWNFIIDIFSKIT